MSKRLRIVYLAALTTFPASERSFFLLRPTPWLWGALAALAAWAYVRLEPLRLAENRLPSESPGVERGATNGRELVFRLIFVATALIWAWIRFLDPPWIMREAVNAAYAGGLGAVAAAAYLRERSAGISPLLAWLLPVVAGVFLGYSLSISAELLYSPWLDRSRYPRDERPLLIAFVISLVGFLGLLIDLRNRLWKWQAAESGRWDFAVATILTVGTILPLVLGANLMLDAPTAHPLRILIVALILVWPWVAGISAAVLGFLIQLIRNRWLVGLTTGATCLQLGIWLFIAFYFQW
jgi:hypothetical protein